MLNTKNPSICVFQAVTGSLGRGQRVAVHDITTVAGTMTAAQVAGQAQARATLQPAASANITQKMAAMAAGTSALAGGKSKWDFIIMHSSLWLTWSALFVGGGGEGIVCVDVGIIKPAFHGVYL